MYKVVLSRQARRYFEHASRDVAERLASIFQSLESDIHPPHSKALQGRLEGLWRIRMGSIRIVYEPKMELKEIRIIKIGPRGDIYEK
ncbi:type II toxin-antitoxin system RelE/ParE family toxin [Candidatus Sumerlaeota bacterium]|nr:type II toxin-antitoxin system RelE/ParE family toxin [Candidatus Sumerlaeota bacterium]